MSEQHLHQIMEQNTKRNGASPQQKIPPIPPTPTGETASGSQDKPKDDNPEPKHEAKGKQGRPSNSQGPPPVKKDNLKKGNPKHDTEKDMNRTRTHWRKASRQYLVDQLSKHGWKLLKTRDGKLQKPHKKNWHKL